MRDERQADGLETLAQRFVDQELSPGDRVRVATRLGRGDELRRRVLALERVAQIAGNLPRSAVPDGFTAGVLVAIDERPSRWRGIVDLFRTPRHFEWNLAGAALACAALVAAGGLVARLGPGWGARRPVESRVPAEASARVLVRLVVLQPEARTVQVAGDFNGWDPMKTPLAPTASGAWTVTLPLEPGRYKYMFVVDGSTWVVDPFAAEEADDGFGSRNAVLDVQPPGGRL